MSGSIPAPVAPAPIELSVVIPAYNEAARVGDTVRRILDYLERRGKSFELLLVDDGSRDGTLQAGREAAAGDSRLLTVRLERNLGKGAAVRAGVLQARGERVLFSDADLSTPIEELEKLEDALEGGVGAAFASRALPASNVAVRQPLYRQSMGKIFNLFVQLLVLPGVRDSQCGFKLFRADVAQEAFRHGRLNGFCFDVEILFLIRRQGIPMREVPVAWYDSSGSQVHPVLDSTRMLLDLLRIRWNSLIGAYRRPGSFSVAPGADR